MLIGMTHQDWITAIATAIAAAVGGLAGGVLALVGAWLTNRTTAELAKREREDQHKEAEEQRRAALEAAARERELDRSEQRQAIARNAAVGLLGRIGDLDRVLPMVHEHRPGVDVEQVAPRVVAFSTPDERQRLALAIQTTRDGVDSLRRGLRTELLLIHDAEVVTRYRDLARLVSDFQVGAGIGGAVLLNRAYVDVSNYMKYVLITLQAFIDGVALPETTAPPILQRNHNDGSTWMPQVIPEDWDRI